MTEVLTALITAAGTITAAWLATRQSRRSISTSNDAPPSMPDSKSGTEDEESGDPTS